MMVNPGSFMIVECSQCHTKFKIADEKITDRGVKVRCSKCKHMFVVKPGGVEAAPEKVAKGKAAGIPGDIFKAPTRVEPRPPATPPPGKKFPLPLPSVPAGAAPALEDEIDLDSDGPIPAPSRMPSKLPDPPPLDQMPTMPTRPPPKAPTLAPAPSGSGVPAVTVRPPEAPAKSDLGDSLFGDLSLESEAKKPLVEPQGQKPVAAPKPPPPPPPPDDDPFAGIDVSASPQVAEKPPPWAAPAGADPVSGEAVGKPTKDLFDDLGDPFAGIPSSGAGQGVPPPASGDELLPPGELDLPAELVSRSPAKNRIAAVPSASPGRPQDDIFASADKPFAGGKPSPAEADDPFAGIDTTVPTDMPAAGTPGGGAMAGDDPFTQLDSSMPAGAPEADEEALPSGLELDSDGRLTGKPLPEPPPPTKVPPVQAARPEPDRPAPAAAAPSLPMAAPGPQKTPSSGVLWAYKLGFGLLALLVALLLFVAYRSGGKPDLTSWSTYVRAFTGEDGAREVSGDLEAAGVKNTAYATRSGHLLVVVWGKVNNKTRAEKKAVVVSGQLLNEKGEELGRFTAPAGIVFTPQEVFAMDDHLAVASAYHSRLEQVRDLKIPPRGDAPFMLVFYDHPEEMDEIRIRVLPEESPDPLRGLPPQTEPADGGEGPAREANGPGAKPSGKKPPASSAGGVVKQKGDVVRLKPKPKPKAEEEEEEEEYDVPVEVVEDEEAE